ncbi:hypothetical protein AB0B57_02045 [Micromonospora sp. NPDC049101]|uniref:TolB family protein n=1 Tax=Micromonospora sp. NPDC049101 TaxID=3155032 RepID=UPI0033E2C312
MRTLRIRAIVAVTAAWLVTVNFALPARAADTSIERVSVSSTDAQGNSSSSSPEVSADGRYIAFASYATNLVPDDTNQKSDIFVRDRFTGATERVSTTPNGTQADWESSDPAISADGRYVAFATDLAIDDLHHSLDVYVHDRVTGSTGQVNNTNNSGVLNNFSFSPAISADGRYIAFTSWATDLVPDDTNQTTDIFVYDRTNGSTQRVNISGTGAQADQFSFQPALSADGRYVAFSSWAGNLVDEDTNQAMDVFVHDRASGTTQRVNVTSTGAQSRNVGSDPSISADGRVVAFQSYGADLVPDDTNQTADIFVHDRGAGTTQRVSSTSTGTQANAESYDPMISADGRHVAFASYATNLVPDDTNQSADVFLRDLTTGITRRVDVSYTGGQADQGGQEPAVNTNGQYVAFASYAANLVPNDTNQAMDVFFRDLELRGGSQPTAPATVTPSPEPPGPPQPPVSALIPQPPAATSVPQP